MLKASKKGHTILCSWQAVVGANRAQPFLKTHLKLLFSTFVISHSLKMSKPQQHCRRKKNFYCEANISLLDPHKSLSIAWQLWSCTWNHYSDFSLSETQATNQGASKYFMWVTGNWENCKYVQYHGSTLYTDLVYSDLQVLFKSIMLQ